MVVIVTIITPEAIVVPAVSIVAIYIDNDRSRNRVTTLFVVYRRWGTIYRRIVYRPFVINRDANPDIQTHLSPSITAAAQKHERDNNYLFHLILLSGIVGPFYMR